jgi:hypothetical protein
MSDINQIALRYRAIADEAIAMCKEQSAELTRLRAQVAGLTDAYWKLCSYAIHDDDCKLNKPPFKAGSCSCGLTKAITAGEEIAALSAYEGEKG